jgi:hypothetical protein
MTISLLKYSLLLYSVIIASGLVLAAGPGAAAAAVTVTVAAAPDASGAKALSATPPTGKACGIITPLSCNSPASFVAPLYIPPIKQLNPETNMIEITASKSCIQTFHDNFGVACGSPTEKPPWPGGKGEFLSAQNGWEFFHQGKKRWEFFWRGDEEIRKF